MLVTALAIGVMVVWCTSLVICAIVFWPILAIALRRARQQGHGAAEDINPE
jgi:hypothetical protein